MLGLAGHTRMSWACHHRRALRSDTLIELQPLQSPKEVFLFCWFEFSKLFTDAFFIDPSASAWKYCSLTSRLLITDHFILTDLHHTEMKPYSLSWTCCSVTAVCTISYVDVCVYTCVYIYCVSPSALPWDRQNESFKCLVRVVFVMKGGFHSIYGYTSLASWRSFWGLYKERGCLMQA